MACRSRTAIADTRSSTGRGTTIICRIQEVVSRRYREAGQSNELYPDVILIDGGLGQLHAAMDVFKTMDVKPPMVISLAKKEELVYTQARSEPIRLRAKSSGLETAAIHPR